MKSILMGILVVLAVLGVVFVSYGQSEHQNIKSSTTSPQYTSEVVTNNTTASSNDSGAKISQAEAQKLAAKYIKADGVKAGTPKLVKEDGKLVYLVPLTSNGKTVGEIDIDAVSGSNLGGSGGAP